jgi:hypothetical protein
MAWRATFENKIMHKEINFPHLAQRQTQHTATHTSRKMRTKNKRMPLSLTHTPHHYSVAHAFSMYFFVCKTDSYTINFKRGIAISRHVKSNNNSNIISIITVTIIIIVAERTM